MKLRVRLVGRLQLIKQNDRETKLIFSTGLNGVMIFCNEAKWEDSRLLTIN